MKRASIMIFVCLTALLAAPVGAFATLTEVGELPETTPATVPSCPGTPCLAVSRTTGFQVKVGTTRSVVTAPRSGTIVAWKIDLGKPTAAQIKFFNENEGGEASAGIAILRQQKKPNLTYELIASSPLVKLEPYFGMSAQFPLEKTIAVKKGDIIALSVPSWAPALALGFSNTTSWRASRPKTQCSSTGAQSSQTEVSSMIQYYCLYSTARLTYSATLISTP